MFQNIANLYGRNSGKTLNELNSGNIKISSNGIIIKIENDPSEYTHLKYKFEDGKIVILGIKK